MTRIDLISSEGNFDYEYPVLCYPAGTAFVEAEDLQCPDEERPGDNRQVAWPDPHMDDLVRILRQDRDLGLIPADAEVYLPNGERVEFREAVSQ